MERLELLKEVFDEKSIKIINLFLEDPKRHFTLTEIVGKTGISFATAHRRLNYLISREILKGYKKENTKKIKSYKIERSEKVAMLSKVFDTNSNLSIFGNLD